MTNIDKIKSRVQKLLAHAHDRRDTPEYSIYLDRAMELMARYGFDERDLENPNDGDAMVAEEFKVGGSYTYSQAVLLTQIASELHCVAVLHGVYNSNRVETVTVFGSRRHVERVQMLFAVLNPQMLAQAKDNSVSNKESGVSTVVLRRSFMQGFASTIGLRLREAEGNVAAEVGERYAVALRDDLARAKDFYQRWLEEKNLKADPRKGRSKIDPGAYVAGGEAARNSDLGQSRVANRGALNA